MAQLLLEKLQPIKGIAPVADAHAGGVTSDVYDFGACHQMVFLSYRGVATGGTAAPTLTVLACDDTTPSNTTAIPFWYRLDGGALTRATATGIQLGAGSAKLDSIVVDESDMASTGYRYVQLNVAETVNDPVVATIIALAWLKDARATYQTLTD